MDKSGWVWEMEISLELGTQLYTQEVQMERSPACRLAWWQSGAVPAASAGWMPTVASSGLAQALRLATTRACPQYRATAGW